MALQFFPRRVSLGEGFDLFPIHLIAVEGFGVLREIVVPIDRVIVRLVATELTGMHGGIPTLA